jgi:ribosome maturation factor RimP
MNKKEILREVIDICNPIALSLDYELVDVEYLKEFGSYYLRVYIDKPGGITLDDCQNMSEILSDKLDKKDPISTAYYLEVSSPGLDRPLKTDKDLKRNLGKDIEISLYTPINNKKMYEGRLENYNEDLIIIKDEVNALIEIPRQSVSNIKLALKF